MSSPHKWLMGQPKTIDSHQSCLVTLQATLAASTYSCCGCLLITVWGWLRHMRKKAKWWSGMFWNSTCWNSTQLQTGFIVVHKPKHSHLTQFGVKIKFLPPCKTNTLYIHTSALWLWSGKCRSFTILLSLLLYPSDKTCFRSNLGGWIPSCVIKLLLK